MAAGAALNLANVSRAFPGEAVPLFAGFSLRLEPGRTLALLGRSGVGKSSLLRMLAGTDTEYQGQVEIDGVPAHRAPPPGFVFQDPRLLPWLSARANVMAASPTITPARADALLARVGLHGREGALPHEISGGMQRRVALARAMARQPALLLLDEPFVSLDPALVRELQDLLLQIVAEDRPTVVLVSHSASDAARLADRIVLLEGRPVRIAGDLSPDVPPRQRDIAARQTIEADLLARGEAAA